MIPIWNFICGRIISSPTKKRDFSSSKQKFIIQGKSKRIDQTDDEIFLEYDIDRDDYPTKEDYLEAVDETKYGWRDAVEDGSEYDIDPEDYETLLDHIAKRTR